MSTVLAMVALGWRQLFRDRFALAGTFLLPVLVATLMVDVYQAEDEGAQPVPVGVLVESEDGPVGQAIVDRLERGGVIDVEGYDDRTALERAIRRRDLVAGVVVPAAVERSPDGSASPEVQLLGQPTVATPGGVRAAVETAVAETAAALHVGRAVTDGEVGPDQTDQVDGADGAAQALARGNEELAGTVQIHGRRPAEASSGRLLGQAAWALLATMVLFVFTNTMIAGMAVADARELGILARARTTRASSGTLATGLAMNIASYALFMAGLMMATGWLVFGIAWTSIVPTAVVLVVLVLAAAGLGIWFGTLLPSSELSMTIGGPLGFLLAMVGGALWPLEIVGPTLQRIGHLTPHAWALDALRETAVDGGGLADVAVPVAVLAGMAAALVTFGALRLRRIAERA